MKKKLFLLSIPIILSISGVIYLQIDWLYKTYAYESQSINILADKALKDAIKRMTTEKTDSVERFLLPQVKGFADSVQIQYSRSPDSLKIKLRNKEEFGGELFGSKSIYSAGRLQVSLPYTAGYFLLTDADSQYSLPLSYILKPFTSTSDSLFFHTDSVKISKYFLQNLSSSGVTNAGKLTRFNFYQGVDIPISKKVAYGTSAKRYTPQGMNAYFGELRWVSVHFQSYTRLILSKMVVAIGLSGLLILIMIFAFVYLVNIILNQKRLAEMKDDFISNLTHEFKTPIATIAVAIEGLKSFNGLQNKEKTERYLEVSKNELNRLNSMVSKILNLAAQEKNTIQLQRSEINLTEMINELMEIEDFKASKQINFSISIDKDANKLMVDSTHFRNAIMNLVDNAIKYANEKVEITITAAIEDKNVCISIRDNGIGIPASELRYIFDKFYRVSNGNIYNSKGIGLGLNYVKSIIELHNGNIKVKSTVGVGTEFKLFLPLN
ncbi:MAG: HAMP domain-containing histidine kinase [Pedobacter sp.]|nr:MAG: HAMP domain-containing histidine kinase [Pedobacter sp.]